MTDISSDIRSENEELMRLVSRVGAISKRNRSADGTVRVRGYGHILSALSNSDKGMSQQEIADLLSIRPQSLSEALSSLEERGFVKRYVSDGDKRKSIVCITETGIVQNKFLSEERRVRADRIYGVLTDSEREALKCIMLKLICENSDK